MQLIWIEVANAACLELRASGSITTDPSIITSVISQPLESHSYLRSLSRGYNTGWMLSDSLSFFLVFPRLPSSFSHHALSYHSAISHHTYLVLEALKFPAELRALPTSWSLRHHDLSCPTCVISTGTIWLSTSCKEIMLRIQIRIFL